MGYMLCLFVLMFVEIICAGWASVVVCCFVWLGSIYMYRFLYYCFNVSIN
jgi:hypothetical protein